MSAQRGIEEIFESEPNIDSSLEVSQVCTSNSEDISSSTFPAGQAFEIFNGRLYYNASSQPQICTKNELELPWDRLSRIKFELSQLAADLENMKCRSIDNDSTIYAALLTEVSSLNKGVVSIEDHPAMKSLESGSLQLNDLNEIISKFQQHNKVSNESTDERQHHISREYVELLESRVAFLESKMGDNSIQLGKQLTLADTILQLEQKVNVLDSSSIDNIKSKLTTLRIELEAVNKSRTAAFEPKLWDAINKVDDALSWISTVHVYANELPQLICRLKSVEDLHKSAVSISNRFLQSETTLASIATELSENRKVIENVKGSLVDNITSMNENIKHIESKLSKKRG